ncbi:hypothetical protein [Brevibacterium moorei]|uniref:hypothetical protein n=1 Tax=Brevibacterium moorei TaxID=2968457 RepID=UPI00211C724D|nr:hypothetical protein [Brevibacterium sp. 68QC2CO]MCQ9384412.1 hypothetical protein [Brevibacterium sp. 68QC2CO]
MNAQQIIDKAVRKAVKKSQPGTEVVSWVAVITGVGPGENLPMGIYAEHTMTGDQVLQLCANALQTFGEPETGANDER